jgi:hypothetical protein
MCEAAHIYPCSMLNPSSAPPPEFDLWDILKGFGPTIVYRNGETQYFQIRTLLTKVLRHVPTFMCLSRDVHGYWRKGYFALKPQKCLEVEFHWMP